MRTRTTLALSLVALVAVGSATPTLAAKPKPLPKPITGSYTANATPDPTSTNPVTNNPCRPNLPGSMDSHPFTIPAKGTLVVSLENKLDWSIALRDTSGADYTTADGGSPTTKEVAEFPFKKKTQIVIDACNFMGEPSVKVDYTFTFKR